MKPDEGPAEAALGRAFDGKQMYWHACHGNGALITFRSEADFRRWFLSEMAEHGRQVRAEVAQEIADRRCDFKACDVCQCRREDALKARGGAP